MDTITSPAIKRMSPQLLVADMDRSIEFYTKNLGFVIGFRYADFYSGIIKDNWSIHLKTGQPYTQERTKRRSSEDVDIVFSIERIEDLYNELLHKAIEITQPLINRPYGREFYITDPDGYILAFVEEA